MSSMRRLCKEIINQNGTRIAGFMLVFYVLGGVGYGIYSLVSLPTSFTFERLSIVCGILYILCFLVLSIFGSRRSSELETKQKEKPLQSYLGMRLRAAKYLDMPDNIGEKTRHQKLIGLANNIIVSKLEGDKEEESKCLDEARKMMLEVERDFLSVDSSEKRVMAKKALFYQMKKMIKHPMDLQGKRRTKILINILSKILNSSCLPSLTGITNIISGLFGGCIPSIFCKCFRCIFQLLSRFFRSCWNPLISCTSCFSSCCGKSPANKYLATSILKASAVMFFLTIVPFGMDILSDFKVVTLYWRLWSSSGNQSMTSQIQGQINNNFSGTEILIPIVFLTLFLGLSIFLMMYSNPLKKMSRQLKTKIKLNNPNVEKNYETLSTSSLLQRYDLPVDESGMESSFQFIFQFGIYFSIVPLLHVLLDQTPNDPTLQNFDKELKFVDDLYILDHYIPGIPGGLFTSGIFSLLSLAMGHVKRNAIFNELNISSKQWILYFFSSLFSTVPYVLLLTTITTSFLGVQYWDTKKYPVQMSDVFGQSGFLYAFSLLSFILVLLFYANIISLITGNSQNSHKSKLRASTVSVLTTAFTPFLLPTSQYITRCRYNIYNNSLLESPHLLRRLVEQCLVYAAFIGVALILISRHGIVWTGISVYETLANSTFVDMSRYQSNGTYLLPPSLVADARQNLIIATWVMIPVGFLVSHLLLWTYFKYDGGYFGTVNMDYWFDKDGDSSGDVQMEVIPLLYIAPQAALDGPDGEARRDNVNVTDKKLTTGCQAWIETDVEEDWYSWSKIKAWTSGKSAEACQELNMDGYWVDLTGDEGVEEICEDGDAVENGQKGTTEYEIKMSFPFYRENY